jgi:hypothetical protein
MGIRRAGPLGYMWDASDEPARPLCSSRHAGKIKIWGVSYWGGTERNRDSRF